MDKGFSAAHWMTYRQALELTGQVRKGEHGSLVVYADRITRTGTNDNGAEIETETPFMKGYAVFNVEQIDGLPEYYYGKRAAQGEKLQLIESAESFFAATGATPIRHGGNRAFYASS